MCLCAQVHRCFGLICRRRFDKPVLQLSALESSSSHSFPSSAYLAGQKIICCLEPGLCTHRTIPAREVARCPIGQAAQQTLSCQRVTLWHNQKHLREGVRRHAIGRLQARIWNKGVYGLIGTMTSSGANSRSTAQPLSRAMLAV